VAGEQLGQVVLDVRVDIGQADAALNAFRARAEAQGRAIAQALSSGASGGGGGGAGAAGGRIGGGSFTPLGGATGGSRGAAAAVTEESRKTEQIQSAIEARQARINALNAQTLRLQKEKLSADASRSALIQQQIGYIRLEAQEQQRGLGSLREKLTLSRRQTIDSATAAAAAAAAASAESAFGRMSSAARSAGGATIGLYDALLAVGAVATVGGFLRGSIQAAVELETITKKLSNTLGETGAARALQFTRQQADTLGLSFTVLANSFGSFTAAASAAGTPLKVQEDLFAAVSRASQSLGLSNDELSGSLLALQQIASKGTVQMEELRGQLGERLPIAFGAAAKGLGITQRELIKLVETGRLTAAQFFPALTKGLNELTANSGGTATSAQNFQKLGNAWKELQTQLGTNLLPRIIPQVKALTDALDGLGVVLKADDLGFNNRGIAGLFGFLPDQAAVTVGSLKAIQNQYKLTDQQAVTLFKNARQLQGISPFALPNASPEQIGGVLDKTRELAELWRQKYPDSTEQREKETAEAARLLELDKARLNTTGKINEKIKELQGTRNGLDVNSDAYKEAGIEIEKLQARLEGLRSDAQSPIKLLVDTQEIQKINQARLQQQEAANRELSTINRVSAVYSDRTRTMQQQSALAARITQEAERERQIREATNRKAAADLALQQEGQRQFASGTFDGPKLGQLQSEAAAAGEALELAGAKVAQDIIKGAAEAADRLRQATEGLTSARLGAFDLIPDSSQQQVRQALTAQIQSAVAAGEIDLAKLAQRFPNAATAVQGNFDTQLRLNTDGLSIQELQQVAGQSKALTDATQQLGIAMRENQAAVKELSTVIAGNRSLTVTVPQGAAVAGTGVGADVRYAG